MADDENTPQTPEADTSPVAGRGNRVVRFLRSKEGKLLGLGAAAIALFLLIRHFGQQGAAQVAAATAGAAPLPGVPAPLPGLFGDAGLPAGPAPLPFSDAGSSGGGGTPASAPASSGGGTLGAIVSAVSGVARSGLQAISQPASAPSSSGGGGLGAIASAVSGVARSGLQAVNQPVYPPASAADVAAIAQATQAGVAAMQRAQGLYPVGMGYGAAINNPTRDAQWAHRGITVNPAPQVPMPPPVPVPPHPSTTATFQMLPAQIASSQHTQAQQQQQAASLRLRAGHGLILS